MKHAGLRTPDPLLRRLQQTLRVSVKPLCAAMLSALLLSLSGCATPPAPTPLVQCPKNPPPPALSESLPSRSYSLTWSELAQEWRRRLTGTPTTPAR